MSQWTRYDPHIPGRPKIVRSRSRPSLFMVCRTACEWEIRDTLDAWLVAKEHCKACVAYMCGVRH